GLRLTTRCGGAAKVAAVPEASVMVSGNSVGAAGCARAAGPPDSAASRPTRATARKRDRDSDAGIGDLLGSSERCGDGRAFWLGEAPHSCGTAPDSDRTSP